MGGIPFIPLNPEIDGDIGGDAKESGIRVEGGDEEGAGRDSAGLLTNCEGPSDGWGRLG